MTVEGIREERTSRGEASTRRMRAVDDVGARAAEMAWQAASREIASTALPLPPWRAKNLSAVAERSMAAALFLALQAAAVAGPSPIPGIAPIEFDLARHKASNADTDRGCGSGDGSEIVVCGRRRSGPGYPLEEMALLFKAKPIIAQIGIGGGAAVRAYVESVEMPGGQISKRAMIGIKWPF